MILNVYFVVHVCTDNSDGSEYSADLKSTTTRWVKMEQLLKQRSLEYQQSERLKIIKDYAGEIDTLLSQSAILSGSKQKNEQKLARFKVNKLLIYITYLPMHLQHYYIGSVY